MANKKLAYERIVSSIITSKNADHCDGCRQLIMCYAKQYAFTTNIDKETEALFVHLNTRIGFIENIPTPNVTAMALLDNEEQLANHTEMDPNPVTFTK